MLNEISTMVLSTITFKFFIVLLTNVFIGALVAILVKRDFKISRMFTGLLLGVVAWWLVAIVALVLSSEDLSLLGIQITFPVYRIGIILLMGKYLYSVYQGAKSLGVVVLETIKSIVNTIAEADESINFEDVESPNNEEQETIKSSIIVEEDQCMNLEDVESPSIEEEGEM